MITGKKVNLKEVEEKALSFDDKIIIRDSKF